MLFGDFSDWLFIVKVVTVVYSAHAKNDSTYALPWRPLLLPLIASRRRENPSSLLYGARAYFCCNISCCNIFCCIPTIFLLHPGKRCLKFLLLALKSQHWNTSHIMHHAIPWIIPNVVYDFIFQGWIVRIWTHPRKKGKFCFWPLPKFV